MEPETNKLLEIIIITYNRSVYLDNTLRQLVDCPFSVFSIIILDNCSEDNTHEIFLKYQDRFPDLKYVKNKINIGADANVLRAAELSNGQYTWVLADDDEYDFTNCDDILEELAKQEVAAIMVGWSKPFIWPKGGMRDSPVNLIKKGFPCLSVPTFVPSSIFKTSLFQNQIRTSYTNIVNLFPAMTYYIKLYDTNEYVYVSKYKIVTAAGLAAYDYTFLRVMAAVINTYYLIDSPHVRRQAFNACYPNVIYKTFIDYVLMMKNSKNLMSFQLIIRYLQLLNWHRKILFIIVYTGAPLVSKLINIYKYFKNKFIFNT